jgi:crenactin
VEDVKYKARFVYAEDYGTGYFKYGPITLGEVPRIMPSRGLLLRDLPESMKLLVPRDVLSRGVVVGDEVSKYLSSLRDAIRNLKYPLHDGIVRREDEDAWRVVKEMTRFTLSQFHTEASRQGDYKGFLVVAALSALAPDYMKERFIEVHSEVNRELGGGAVRAVTIIDQPFAVAIAEKAVTCIVIEAGHGNTQVVPISYGPIRDGIVALNRGGAEANAITREILKDAGYSDLAKDDYVVEVVKREIGLIPRDLDEAIKKAKEEPSKFAASVKVNPLVTIELKEYSWMRFLIGEILFNPTHEIFRSYTQQGRLSIEDVTVGDMVFHGEMSLSDAIINSVRRTPVEIQDKVLENVILSGGSFSWKTPPEGLRDVAVTSPEKVKIMISKISPELAERVNVKLVNDPQFSVWKGAIVYGYALPLSVKWNERTKEGWYFL